MSVLEREGDFLERWEEGWQLDTVISFLLFFLLPFQRLLLYFPHPPRKTGQEMVTEVGSSHPTKAYRRDTSYKAGRQAGSSLPFSILLYFGSSILPPPD